MMRSESGTRPVISMSIQMRLFWSCATPPLVLYALEMRAILSQQHESTVFGLGFPQRRCALASATRLWLAWRQVRHVRAHRDAVPPAFAQAISLAAHQKAADYTVAKNRLAAWRAGGRARWCWSA